MEDNGYRLTDHRHMTDMVSFALNKEQTRIKGEIKGKHVAIIFDGTTCLGEALAVVVKQVTQDFNIRQHLLLKQYHFGSDCALKAANH